MKAAAAWGIALWLLGAAPTWAAALAPAKLALVVPGAGEMGGAGRHMRWAAEMALADWQGMPARPVELVVHEDRFDTGQAVTLARGLVKEAVWGVVGHFYSSTSIAAAAVYAGARIPQLVPAASHPRLTALGYPTVFRIAGRDDQQAAAAASVVRDRLGSRRVAMIHDRTEYGRTLTEAFRMQFSGDESWRLVPGGEIAQGDTAFPDLIGRLAAVRADAVYFGGNFREAGLLLRQMHQAGKESAFLGGDAVLDPEFVIRAGEAALRDVYLTSLPDPRRLTTAAPVIERFEARHGRLDRHALYAYDAVGAFLWALRAGQPESAAPEEREKLLRVLHSGAYPSALGMLRWDARGDRVPSPYVVYAAARGGSLHGWFEQALPAVPPERGSSQGRHGEGRFTPTGKEAP